MTALKAAHRECIHPRCAAFALRGESYCAEHVEATKPGGYQKEYGNLRPNNRTFRRLRAAFLNAHPMCNVCKREAATDLDHIQPHRGSSRLFWDQTNWQGLCGLCHHRKSASEAWGTRAGGLAV